MSAVGERPATKVPGSRVSARGVTPPVTRRYARDIVRRRLASLLDARQQRFLQFGNLDPRLLHRIALPQGDGSFERRPIFTDGIEINGDTEWRAGFVLPAVATPDCSGVIIKHVHPWPQQI